MIEEAAPKPNEPQIDLRESLNFNMLKAIEAGDRATAAHCWYQIEHLQKCLQFIEQHPGKRLPVLFIPEREEVVWLSRRSQRAMRRQHVKNMSKYLGLK